VTRTATAAGDLRGPGLDSQVPTTLKRKYSQLLTPHTLTPQAVPITSRISERHRRGRAVRDSSASGCRSARQSYSTFARWRGRPRRQPRRGPGVVAEACTARRGRCSPGAPAGCSSGSVHGETWTVLTRGPCRRLRDVFPTAERRGDTYCSVVGGFGFLPLAAEASAKATVRSPCSRGRPRRQPRRGPSVVAKACTTRRGRCSPGVARAKARTGRRDSLRV
jgi:hypothetical protein